MQIFPFSFIVTYRGRAQEFRPQWLFIKVYYVCFQHSAWIWFFSFWCEAFSCNQKYPPLVQAKQRINRSYALIYITMLGRASGFLGLIRPHFLRHKQWPQRRRAATSLWPRREKGAGGVLSKVLYGGPISYFFVKKEPPSKKKTNWPVFLRDFNTVSIPIIFTAIRWVRLKYLDKSPFKITKWRISLPFHILQLAPKSLPFHYYT